MENMDYFLEIYAGLPRAGPGSYESTLRAFEMMTGVSSKPRILDIGCGPGVQTVDLLKISNGTVLALDFLPVMVDRTRTNAESARVSERLEVHEQDMQEMDFPACSFDVIWSEGAIYNLGFENGLKRVMDFVRPGGFVAVSEVVWLKPDPPTALLEYWKQYPEIDLCENKLAVIKRRGYESKGYFILPDKDWITDYYGPMENLIAQKSGEWSNNPNALEVIEEARNEMQIFHRYSNYFGYAFFVMNRPR